MHKQTCRNLEIRGMKHQRPQLVLVSLEKYAKLLQQLGTDK